MKHFTKTVLVLLAVTVTVNGFAQSKIMRQINDYKATIESAGAVAKIKPICGKGKKATHTLNVELYFPADSSYSVFQELEENGAPDVHPLSEKEKQDILSNVAVSAWWEILDKDLSFKKIYVKVEIAGLVRLEQCFIPIEAEKLALCGPMKETDLTGKGLCKRHEN